MPALKSTRIARVTSSLEPISSRNTIYHSPVVCRSPINRTPLCEHFQNISQRVNSNQIIVNNSHSLIKLKIMASGSSSGLVPMSSDTMKFFVEKEISSRQESDLTTRPLILDCRPFLVHSESHIMGSISVHCPAILRYVLKKPHTCLHYHFNTNTTGSPLDRPCKMDRIHSFKSTMF